jgi:hypothetical protein
MKRIFIILSAMLIANGVFGQSIQDVSFSAVDSASSGIIKSSFVVQLTDTLQIDQIEVKVGSNEGLSNLLNYSFGFDQTSGLPNDFAYSRDAKRVLLDTGTITEFPTYFGRVRLKLSNGQYTDYFSFISN